MAEDNGWRGAALVTGASGFIGRHLVRALLEQERRVLALSREPRHLEDISHPLLKVIAGDLEQPRSYVPFPSDTTTVFHLAGVRSAPGTSVRTIRRVNVEATLALGRAAVAARVERFVNVSSALVFGPSGERPLTEENGYCRPPDTIGYIDSRVRALEEIKELVKEGLSLVTVCPAIVFGPDHQTHPNRVTNHLRRLLRSRSDLVIGGGGQRRTLVFVADVVRGLLLAERVGRVGEEYILGGDDLSHRELNQMALSLAGRAARLTLSVPVGIALTAARVADSFRGYERASGYAAAVRGLTREWRYSSQKAERDLGYRYAPVRDGLRQTVRFLTERIA